jgi:hypothetical protein
MHVRDSLRYDLVIPDFLFNEEESSGQPILEPVERITGTFKRPLRNVLLYPNNYEQSDLITSAQVHRSKVAASVSDISVFRKSVG